MSTIRPSETAAPAPAPNRLRTMAANERPQERLDRHGPSALSDTELLAMLLRSGTAGSDVMTLAERLLSQAGSLAGFVGWTKGDYRRFKGVGTVKALQLLAVMEIARRVVSQQAGPNPQLERPPLVAAFMEPLTRGLEVEKLWVLCLNQRGRLLRCTEITSGLANQTLVHPREVFRVAVRDGATQIVVVHNHPSGDPTPSPPDIAATRRLRAASEAVEICLLDHVIVGRAHADPTGLGYFSFRAGGFL